MTLFERIADSVDRGIGSAKTFILTAAMTILGIAVVILLVLAGQFELVNAIDNALGAITGIAAILLLVLMSAAANRRETQVHERDVVMHAKLDELIRAIPEAKNELIAAEVERASATEPTPWRCAAITSSRT